MDTIDFDSVNDADNYIYRDLGLAEVGYFDKYGTPCEFAIMVDHLAEHLPRYLLKEPVLFISDASKHEYGVYIRGLFSPQLTKIRKATVLGSRKNK